MAVQILNQAQINQKIKRLSIEILERNLGEQELILAGINNNGTGFANLLHAELIQQTSKKITLTRILLNPANPLSKPVEIELSPDYLHQKSIIIVDDVANTGRTIFYAFKPLLDILPKKVEVAVLVDRKHKFFPVQVDYVGLSLATTLQENIDVKILNTQDKSVFLD